MITFLTQVNYSPLARPLTDLEVNGVVCAMIIGGLKLPNTRLRNRRSLFVNMKASLSAESIAVSSVSLRKRVCV